MKQYQRAGVVACSNGLSVDAQQEMRQLKRVMANKGIELVFSDVLYAREGIRNGTGKERAAALMKFYCDDSIDVIFDVSGGDVAQEVLEHLDYEKISKTRTKNGYGKPFWGYSDLTVLLNAIYTKTGNPGVLYQIRYLEDIDVDKLFQPSYHFLQGSEMSGILVGGNVRCLLKLAGTEYFPDMTDKILFLEARSGLEPQIRTYLQQLEQLGVFDRISGLFIGTFTQWENELMQLRTNPDGDLKREGVMTIEKLVLESVPENLPVAKTYEVGHASTSKALCIGKELCLMKENEKFEK